ncbi:MAG: hypothetical protein U5R48_18430 [Gammaproteobacteria bacterium]|nr:hypothetical protein [Gammaproteobacteria bacterium]
MDPAGLTIPGTGLTVADVATMLADEADAPGTAGVDTTELRETITETLPANPLPDLRRRRYPRPGRRHPRRPRGPAAVPPQSGTRPTGTRRTGNDRFRPDPRPIDSREV